MAESDAEMGSYEHLVAAQNRKRKKAGGFQSFGFDHVVYKGLIKKGYKAPTPIQRKAIPLLLDGKDVVAMARTGSGKTAAFLLPLFQKLKCRNAKSGVRALLISPTRELALQTFKFFKELGKFVGLRATVLVGGDAMEEQFSAIHENPDVIIATPGRLMHVVVEMNLQLKSVQYVIFDEADRLFEIGFEEQLLEVLKRLPDNRQTSLFSATLPKSVVDFAKAGLNQPTLVRLDVDSKLSDQLKTSFIFARSDDKLAVLLFLLRSVVDSGEQTIIFAATKHHIEYLKVLLTKANFQCSYLYSALDGVARQQQIETFRRKRTNILLSTDLAARGVDIPLLDVAINFHFPAKAKLFVHRVGRVARAGRSGRAFSIVSPEEMPYLVDLYLFLGRSLQIMRNNDHPESIESDAVGTVPQTVIDVEEEMLRGYHDLSAELVSLKQLAGKAYQQYVRSRPTPSAESVKRVKRENMLSDVAFHPVFSNGDGEEAQAVECERAAMLNSLKNYKPQVTVFELGTSNKHETWKVMKAKRAVHGKKPRLEKAEEEKKEQCFVEGRLPLVSKAAAEEDIQESFAEIIDSKFKLRDSNVEEKVKARKSKKKQKTEEKKDDGEYFIPYRPLDFHSEKGLSLEKSGFEKAAEAAVLDLTGDDDKDFKKQRNQKKWDRKKKKFVSAEETVKGGRVKKVRTESGIWIPASYKSDLYEKWKKKRKVGFGSDDEEGGEDAQRNTTGRFGRTRRGRGKGSSVDSKGRKPRSELKKPENILKERKRKASIQSYQRHRQEQKSFGRRGRKGERTGADFSRGKRKTGKMPNAGGKRKSR